MNRPRSTVHRPQPGFPNEEGRPQKRLKQILDSGQKDFHKIFTEFWKSEAIYGFGDVQVKQMPEKIS